MIKKIQRIELGLGFLILLISSNPIFAAASTSFKATSLPSNIRYSGKNLSLQFQNISVRAALQLLAQFANINLVVTDSVRGDITLRLHQVPWDQALDIIMQTKGLGSRKMGDTIIIAPAVEIAKRETEELEAQKQVRGLEPMLSMLLQINYGKASEIAALLKGSGKSILSERGSVSVDARTNTLWIQDTPDKLAEIRKLIECLDMPVKQVLIEARIVNIDKKYEKELGIRWGISSNKHLSGSLAGANDSLNTAIREVPFTNRLNVNLPAIASGAGTFGMALIKLTDGILLDLELSALQTEGNVKIIASPRLITANQKEALIEAGEEIPYQEATSSGATAVSFKKAVLSLKVTPQITPDNRIILDIKVNQDKRGPEVLLGVPSIDTREIQSQILVDNGQTVVLGGIYQKDEENQVERIPFLGDLPLVGILFRHILVKDKRSELLIFITPKIINQSFYQ